VLHRRAGGWAVPGHTLNEGTTLLLPGVNRRERTLEVYEVEDPVRDLEAGTRGDTRTSAGSLRPRRPPGRAAGFVLVPGVAFDRRGGRLGYGGGFYDRLLSGGVSPSAWLVAAALGAQIVEEVSLVEHDVPVDLVVTEEGCYPPGTPRRRRL
jgi:5-formyltetrahydrofolate cyclo-ligase